MSLLFKTRNPVSSETGAVLTKARDALIERGHHQGWFIGEHGEICMATAIAVGSGRRPTDAVAMDFEEQIEPTIKSLGFDRIQDMCFWNNEPGRTLDDVVARFDKAIAR